MPDTSNMNIMAISGGTDAMNVLTNNVTALNSRRQQQNANGEDFSTVIDATAMSIMAGATLQPVTMTGQFTPPQINDTREFTPVETTTRSTSTRGNDYTQQTQMAEGTRTETGRLETRTQSDFSEGLQTAVDTASQQMTGEAAERLNVTEEELAETMSFANLNAADLLTEDGLTDLVMAVTGEDHAALLTDGALYGDWQALVETAEDLKASLAEDFGMTVEELDEAILTMQEAPLEAADFAETIEKEVQSTELTPEMQIAPETTAEQRERRAVRETEDDAQTLNRDMGQTVAGEAKETQTVQTHEASSQGQQSSERKSTETGDGTQAAETVAQAQTNAEGFLNSVNEALAGTTYAGGTTQTADAQDVLKQVLDYMRSEVREGMTELEMQLNPHSLGRVHVTLQAMDSGEMVARFAAQNDQVREALANQMPELLQRFAEAGIKVNEVEVTVAQQGYNDQRQETEAREDRQREQEAAIGRMGRMHRVQIDLANMDAEDIAALDDGDRIEAEMMAEEGNTVNYRA